VEKVNAMIPIELRLTALAILALFLAWVVKLIRRQRLSVRDSLAWLLTTLLAIVITLFPELLVTLSTRVGIHVPSNAFFAAGILYLAVNVLAVTLAVSANASRTRRLTQECALLRAELEELRREVAGRAGGAK
jgi:hypothetical protein